MGAIEIHNSDMIIDSCELAQLIEDNSDMPDHELKPYRDFAEEFEEHAEDYHHGAIAIRYDHFTEYCRELVADIGYIPDDLPGWIECNIDWSGVAEDLKHDYSVIEFDGVDYYVR